MSEDRPIHTP